MAGRAPARLPHAEGPLPPRVGPFAIVAARFHEAISKKLVDGALEAFAGHRLPADSVEVHWVPGSFELPQAALALARTGRYSGLVAVGVVIRGATPHFDHVARAAVAGLREVGLATGVPVTFGVITALTEEQAWERAGGAVGNRGAEAAVAAIEMARWMAGLRTRRRRSARPRSRGRRR